MFQPIGTPPLCVEIVVTAENAEWLGKLTHTLVADRLVASGHIIAPVQIICHRDGEMVDSTQARVGLHTRATLVSQIVDRVNAEHPGGTVGIVATQLIDGDPDCLQWIVQETADGADHSVASNRDRGDRGRGHSRWVRSH